MKSAKGSMDLADTSINVLQDPKKKHSLQLMNNGEKQVLKFKSAEELNAWYSALQDSINDAIEARDKLGRYSKEGWLDKPGGKRYFKLKKGYLYWYKSEHVF